MGTEEGEVMGLLDECEHGLITGHCDRCMRAISKTEGYYKVAYLLGGPQDGNVIQLAPAVIFHRVIKERRQTTVNDVDLTGHIRERLVYGEYEKFGKLPPTVVGDELFVWMGWRS